MASISCQCEKTRVTFPLQRPAYSLECFCVDCLQKNTYFAQKCGAAVAPEFVTHGQKPLLLDYYCAKMKVTGKENLTFNKLREDSQSVNCVAKCCGAMLFVDNPGYDGKVVLVMPEFRTATNREGMDPIVRAWIKDFTDEAYEKYVASAKSLPCMYKDHSTGEFVQLASDGSKDGGKDFRAAFREAVVRRNADFEAADEETFVDLLNGATIDVLDLEETKNSSRVRNEKLSAL